MMVIEVRRRSQLDDFLTSDEAATRRGLEASVLDAWRRTGFESPYCQRRVHPLQHALSPP